MLILRCQATADRTVGAQEHTRLPLCYTDLFGFIYILTLLQRYLCILIGPRAVTVHTVAVTTVAVTVSTVILDSDWFSRKIFFSDWLPYRSRNRVVFSTVSFPLIRNSLYVLNHKTPRFARLTLSENPIIDSKDPLKSLTLSICSAEPIIFISPPIRHMNTLKI